MAKLPICYKKNKSKPTSERVLDVIIIIFIVLFVINTFFDLFYAKVYIVGTSMNDTFTGAQSDDVAGGDYVYIVKNVEPERGEVVVIDTKRFISAAGEKEIIKRVVGVAGDTVELKAGELYVNGEHVEEPYVSEEHNTPTLLKNTFSAVIVPEGYVYCLGDNRDESVDSRSFYGFIPLDAILGVVSEWSYRYKDAITAFNTFFEFTLPVKLGRK